MLRFGIGATLTDAVFLMMEDDRNLARRDRMGGCRSRGSHHGATRANFGLLRDLALTIASCNHRQAGQWSGLTADH
jgi:hypothetical protein